MARDIQVGVAPATARSAASKQWVSDEIVARNEPTNAGDDWGSDAKPWAIHTRKLTWDGVSAPKTADYTITGAEGHVSGDSSGGNVILTLPSLAANRGVMIPITAEGSGNFTKLRRAGSDTIRGSATDFDMPPGMNLFLFAPGHGTDWRIL